MALKRIGFPFSVEGGRLSLSTGPQAASEAIGALLNIHTGELPLSRDYGADLEYHVPHSVAFGHEARISQKLAEYHPHISLISMTPVLSEDGTLLDWTCEAGVLD